MTVRRDPLQQAETGSFLEGDVDVVCGTHMIHPFDRADIQQAGKTPGWITCIRGARFLVSRP
jgi:hypothetical protein